MTPLEPLVDLDATPADMPPASPTGNGHRLVEDPELDGPDDLEQETPLSELKAELAVPVEGEPATLKVAGRPGYAVRFLPVIDDNEAQKWQRKASRVIPGRAEPQVDRLKLAGFVLAYKCEGIIRNGRLVTDEGEPLVFRSPAFLELMRREGERRPPDVREAIRRFYGRDADLLATSDEIFVRAGYTEGAEEADEVDPTPGR